MKVICFDLEGPLATQDNAYELMKLFPGGSKIFEAISRYDDLLTLEQRAGYEPGDTLALIAPFLVYHDIKEQHIAELARKAPLVKGAAELIRELIGQEWRIFCISTSYEQYALHIAKRIGILPQNVACTIFPLDRFANEARKQNYAYLETLERKVFSLDSIDDNWLKKEFDRFYWEVLPQTDMGTVLRQVKPVGGQRKVDALMRFAQAQDEPLVDWVAVGDSITDFKMLRAVDHAGGLAVAFNANEYALPYATIGLASTHLSDLMPVLEAWTSGKRAAVEQLVKEKEKAKASGDRGHFHWLSSKKDIAASLETHKRIRCIVREDAAKLG